METNENSNRNLTNENSVVKTKLSTARKEGIRKGVIITMITGLVLVIVTGLFVYDHFNEEKVKQLTLMDQQKNSFTQQLSNRDSLINEWLMTFNQIEKDLDMIKKKEKIITVKSTDSEFSKDKRQQILDDLKTVNTLLYNNRKKITQLSAQLKSSGGTLKGLQTKVARLESTMKEYETTIAELKTTLVSKDFEIGQLNNKMTDLESTISQQDKKLSNQDQKLNQAYLVCGTFKDLNKKGIVSKEGGFLGFGKKPTLVKDFSDNAFTRIDVTETKTIPVNSKNVKLITDHPRSSYGFVHKNEDMISYIEIKDPDQFWKISRYAVVEIGK